MKTKWQNTSNSITITFEIIMIKKKKIISLAFIAFLPPEYNVKNTKNIYLVLIITSNHHDKYDSV